jgi:hypothetical protein
MKTFEVTYLAEDGEVRHFNIEAESKEDAINEAWVRDAGNIGGDGMNKIISVN